MRSNLLLTYFLVEIKFIYGHALVYLGEKSRIYNCCSRPTSEGGGCSRGPHVFYESESSDLHARHAFTPTPSNAKGKGTALEVAALDCEMVYTTGGFRVARVSVVDGDGKEVFDELVKMDDGVEVVFVRFYLLHFHLSLIFIIVDVGVQRLQYPFLRHRTLRI